MKLAVMLLAGGESRRMGRDKAMLLLDGIFMWEHQIDILRSISPASLFISAQRRPTWLPPDTQFVEDPQPPRGPLGGIAAVLKIMTATHLLPLPIDMPYMTTAHLADLWAETSPGCGVIPCIGDEVECLPAIYPAQALQIAEALLSGKDVSLRTFSAVLLKSGLAKPHAINPADVALYANFNSPKEWETVSLERAPQRGCGMNGGCQTD